MIIYFVDMEQPEREFFRTELGAEHDLYFVSALDEVPAEAEVIALFINSPIDTQFLDGHPNLQYIATRSGSSDHINLNACRERQVLVSNVPDFGNHTVAEHTFALMLALSRRLREVMDQPQQPEKFTYEAARAIDLYGKTLGIVGLGHIGARVARLAQAFAMRVIAYDPREMEPAHAQEHGVEWVQFEELLAQSHVISLHARLSPWTYHMIDRKALSLCRPGVLIINTSRGRLIETEALREALESGQVGGAGLDVLEEERVMRQPAAEIITAQIVEKLRSDVRPEHSAGGRLTDLKQIVTGESLLARKDVVFTPHVAFNSVEAVERLNAGTVENIRAFARGEPIHLLEPE